MDYTERVTKILEPIFGDMLAPLALKACCRRLTPAVEVGKIEASHLPTIAEGLYEGVRTYGKDPDVVKRRIVDCADDAKYKVILKEIEQEKTQNKRPSIKPF